MGVATIPICARHFTRSFNSPFCLPNREFTDIQEYLDMPMDCLVKNTEHGLQTIELKLLSEFLLFSIVQIVEKRLHACGCQAIKIQKGSGN